MGTKKVIKRIVFVSLWVAAGGGLLSLLLAANSKSKKGVCAGYTVAINGIKNNCFLSSKDVVQLVKVTAKGNIKDQPMADFDLQMLEKKLQENKWVKDAELWFDNKNILHISIDEREPVARIFTTESGSFYIDRELKRMPLSDNVSIRIPVFTGFPEHNKWNKKDSALAADVRTLSQFITGDDFWNAQVAQVNIADNSSFEIIPLLGNQVIRIGKADNLDKKFSRLMIFYRQVLSKTGFDKYSEVDVQYRGQVVAVRRGAKTALVDSAQWKRNIRQLLQGGDGLKDNNDGYIKPSPVSGDKKPAVIPVPPADIPEVSESIQPETRDTSHRQVPRAVMPGRNNK